MMPRVRVTMTVEQAVREISEALGVAYPEPADRLRALIAIAHAIAPVPEDIGPGDPVRWALEEERLRLGHELGLCSRCAKPLVKLGDESFCLEHDAALIALRAQQGILGVSPSARSHSHEKEAV